MTPEQERQALEVLQAAYDSPFGAVVEVETFGNALNSATIRAKSLIYQARADYSHLRALQVRFDPEAPDARLWIVKIESKSEGVGVGAASPQEHEW